MRFFFHPEQICGEYMARGRCSTKWCQKDILANVDILKGTFFGCSNIYMSRMNKKIIALDSATHAIETNTILSIVKDISAVAVQLKVHMTATSQGI